MPSPAAWTTQWVCVDAAVNRRHAAPSASSLLPGLLRDLGVPSTPSSSSCRTPALRSPVCVCSWGSTMAASRAWALLAGSCATGEPKLGTKALPGSSTRGCMYFVSLSFLNSYSCTHHSFRKKKKKKSREAATSCRKALHAEWAGFQPGSELGLTPTDSGSMLAYLSTAPQN